MDTGNWLKTPHLFLIKFFYFSVVQKSTMKKILKFTLITLLVLVVIAGAFAAFVSIRGIPKYDTEQVAVKVISTPENIAHGQKLANMLCVHCHLDPATNKLTGRFMSEMTPEFGPVYSKNITRHPTAGIGSWTDGELFYFLRTGIRPDGQYVPPYMPKLVNISDHDMNAIIAFMRSDAPMLAPAEEEPADSKPSFLTKMLCVVAFKPFKLPAEPIQTPPIHDKVAYGKYLVTSQLTCFGCHSADFKTNDYYTPERSEGYLGGGNILLTMEGEKILSTNITMNKTDGIGNYSEDDFVKVIKSGAKPDGTTVRYPMVPYAELEDEEIRAIYAYLRSVPVIEKEQSASTR
jgi:mono/diheme cytochrome c family protein